MQLLNWITKRSAPFGVLVLIAVIFTAVFGSLLTGRKLFTHDAIIWNGLFQYYSQSIANGVFPYWDPYLTTGTYFYPNISLHGLLDPVVLVLSFVAKIFDLSPLTTYVYFRLYRFLVFLVGVYFLVKYLTRCRTSAAVTVGVLLFSLIPAYFRSAGMIDIIFLTPFSLIVFLKFIEDPGGPRRYLYIAILSPLVGMSMNIYLPTFYLFNLCAFVVVALVMQWRRVREFRSALMDRKVLLAGIFGVIVVLFMMAPPLMVMLKDAGRDGELFPIVRIVQKNDGQLKRIMASDITTSSLSSKFTDGRGVFSSYGNMVQTVFPDAFESVPFFADDLMSEVSQYIGIIPFLFAIIGALYSKSRYRHVLLWMLVIIAINMFSFSGMSSKPYNIVQKMFNLLFPPLEMAEAREAFGVFFNFYLALLASLGFSMLSEPGTFSELVITRFRVLIGICLGVVLFKSGITAYYAGKVVVASAIDGFVILQIFLVAMLLYFFLRNRISVMALQAVLVLVILSDFVVYAEYAEKYIIADGRSHYELAEKGKQTEQQGRFAYFREPLAAPPGVAFGETITKTKGVLTYGNNHMLFSTKRYYDLLTHVPLQNQLAMSGVVYPIIRFYPLDRVITNVDKYGVLKYFESAVDTTLGTELLIENAEGTGGAEVLRSKKEIGSFSQYEDIYIHHPGNLFRFLGEYYAQRGQYLSAIRSNAGPAFFNTLQAGLQVVDFTTNEIRIDVANRVPGYLVYNDGWSKYWTAFDNGREIPVSIANYNSKAVRIDPGRHEIRFIFNPVHYKIGLVLFYVGMIGGLILIGILFFRVLRQKDVVASAPAID